MKVDGWERLRRRGRATELMSACISGVAAACLIFFLAHRHAQHTEPSVSLPSKSSGAVLENVPGTLELGPLSPPVGAFANTSKPDIPLPNLNSSANTVLNDLNGVWSDGASQLVIDARHLRGRFGTDTKASLKPIIVRDLTELMTTLDIGSQRFVLLRRLDGVAVGSASLKTPLELKRLR